MDKNKFEGSMKELVDVAMSLYHTIQCDSMVCDAEHPEQAPKYTTAEDKIKEVLNSEEPVYIPSDDGLTATLYQDVNVGYAVCGVKYLEMIHNSKNISVMVLGYVLDLANRLAKENQDLALAIASMKQDKGIVEKELPGISE